MYIYSVKYQRRLRRIQDVLYFRCVHALHLTCRFDRERERRKRTGRKERFSSLLTWNLCTFGMSRSCCAHLVDALCRCFRWADSSIDGNLGESQQHDVSVNIVLNGECEVGKTSLRNRWVDDVFTGDVSPTFGVDFNMKTVYLVRDQESPPRRAAAPSTSHDDDLKVKMNIYDTSGKPGYREVNSTYMLSFDAMVFVYDISAKRTLNVRIYLLIVFIYLDIITEGRQ